MSLLNTDQRREKEHLATMLRAARDYGRAHRFKGTFLIEPKPMEPMKHQYDVDTETVIAFLRARGRCVPRSMRGRLRESVRLQRSHTAMNGFAVRFACMQTMQSM